MLSKVCKDLLGCSGGSSLSLPDEDRVSNLCPVYCERSGSFSIRISDHIVLRILFGLKGTESCLAAMILPVTARFGVDGRRVYMAVFPRC